jgi:thiol-disulfide isomerase/thioredoxin
MTRYMREPLFVIGVTLALFIGVASSAERTWTDATGGFSVVAELVAVREGKVVLRRQDGKQIAVPLVRLSEKDQRFLKKNQSGGSGAEGEASSKGIAESAERFFRDLQNSDRTEAHQLLTQKAMPLMKGPRSPLGQLPQPSAEDNAIKVGEVKIDGKVAEIPVRVRVAGKFHKTKLHFRFEGEQWRVFAISAAYPDGEKSINFEAEGITDQAADPLQALVGKPLPLSGYTMDGSPLEMANYKGKVVLVDFWATWCGPCRREIPNIMQNWNKYHEKGFEVIAISVDQDREALRAFLAQEQPPWTVVEDRHPRNKQLMGTKYGIRGIPAFLLLGKDGLVAAVNCRGPLLEKQLSRLLRGADPGTTDLGAISR